MSLYEHSDDEILAEVPSKAEGTKRSLSRSAGRLSAVLGPDDSRPTVNGSGLDDDRRGPLVWACSDARLHPYPSASATSG